MFPSFQHIDHISVGADYQGIRYLVLQRVFIVGKAPPGAKLYCKHIGKNGVLNAGILQKCSRVEEAIKKSQGRLPPQELNTYKIVS